jgi:peptide/nickel transport system ATP-binding protein
MITHDLGIVAKICDRVGIVYAGEIIELGSKEDIFDHYAHPYTKGLFGSLPNLSMKEKRLKPIPGLMPDPANLPEGCKFRPRCPHATDACKSKQIPMQEISPGHFVRCIFTDKGRSEN